LKQTIPEISFQSGDKAEAQEDHSNNQQAELRFVTVLLASVVNDIHCTSIRCKWRTWYKSKSL